MLMRLAFRIEGGNWNAYVATMEDLKGAIFIGSIPMRFVQDEKRREAFKSLMKECFADVMEEIVGKRPEFFREDEAPEHERTKE